MNIFGDPIEEVEESEEIWKKKQPSLFDWLNNITFGKEDFRLKASELEGFDPFMICKGLGQSKTTVGFANLMNTMSHIPKEQQYVFYLKGIPKHKNYAKWAKNEMTKEFKEFHKVIGGTEAKAREAWNILTDEQIGEIMSPKGGAGKRKGK